MCQTEELLKDLLHHFAGYARKWVYTTAIDIERLFQFYAVQLGVEVTSISSTRKSLIRTIIQNDEFLSRKLVFKKAMVKFGNKWMLTNCVISAEKAQQSDRMPFNGLIKQIATDEINGEKQVTFVKTDWLRSFYLAQKESIAMVSIIENKYDTTPNEAHVESVEEMGVWFQQLSETNEVANKADNSLISPCLFNEGAGRSKEAVRAVTNQLWFDFDNAAITPSDFQATFSGCSVLTYSTTSAASYRAVIETDRAMTVDEYEHVMLTLDMCLGADTGLDRSKCYAGQFFYLPVKGSQVAYQAGAPLVVDDVIAEFPMPVKAAPKPAATHTIQKRKDDWADDVIRKIGYTSELNPKLYDLSIQMLNACGKDKGLAKQRMVEAINLRGGNHTKKHIRDMESIMAKLT